jgi:hypothetical protein
MKPKQVCFLNSWSPVTSGQPQLATIVRGGFSRTLARVQTSPGHGVVWPFVVAGDKKPRNNLPELAKSPNISSARLLPSAGGILSGSSNNERTN